VIEDLIKLDYQTTAESKNILGISTTNMNMLCQDTVLLKQHWKWHWIMQKSIMALQQKC
jgi:hypothetical protein